MSRLVQVALRATDLDRAAAFYAELLGAEPSGRFEPPGLLFFDLDGVRLLLDGNAPSSMLYLEVPDVLRAVDALRGRAEIDSEDNLLGLVGFEPTSSEPGGRHSKARK